MATRLDHPFQVRAMTDEEGGGYLIEFPDLPGCLSDGETIEEAIASGRRRAAIMDRDRPRIRQSGPAPVAPSDDVYSGRWGMRVRSD